MDLVLGIDLGTSYFKLGLFDRGGNLRGLGRTAVQVETGDGSRAELPVDRFRDCLKQGLAEALAAADAVPGDVVAVSYSSQANTFVLLDAADRPLTPLILWNDSRVEVPQPEVERVWGLPAFSSVTGIGMDSGGGFAVAKLLWLRANEPDTWRAATRVMTISDYLAFLLTGNAVGDAGTAGLTAILDVQKLEWWGEALGLLDIPASLLSAPLRPGSGAGRVTDAGSRLLGVSPGIPFAVGGLDHHMAALGAGVGTLAPFSESTGTVMACLRLSDSFRCVANTCTGPGVNEGEFYTLAFDGNGASVLEWYARNHAPGISFRELDRLAEAVPSGCDGLVARSGADQYDGLEGFENVTSSHGTGHFVRAVLESAARTLGELIDTLSPERPGRIVATGGGAVSDVWLRIKADMLGIEFLRTGCSEPACMGAAMQAAVAAGWFDDIREASEGWISVGSEFMPGQGGEKLAVSSEQ